MSMKRCWPDSKLQEYVDEQLPAGERQRLEEHLHECEACRHAVEETERLAEMAGSLPREIQPSRDLWHGVESRLQPAAVESPVQPRAGAAGPVSGSRGFGLAVAAVLAISVGIVIYGLVSSRPVGPSTAGPSTAEIGSFGGAALIAPYGEVDSQLTEVADGLEDGFRARQATVSPRVRTAIERNLAIVDEAIRLSREAVEADPTDFQAAAMLRDMHRKRIDLLEKANQVPHRL
jgi:hypothetical protein